MNTEVGMIRINLHRMDLNWFLFLLEKYSFNWKNVKIYFLANPPLLVTYTTNEKWIKIIELYREVYADLLC